MLNVPHLDLGGDIVSKSLLLTREKLREAQGKALAKLGVSCRSDEKPIRAYMRHVSEINGVEYTEPCNPELASAIIEHPVARQFLFFLA